MFKPVILESPYAGNTKLNKEYARAAMHDALHRGESPFVSHLLFTQVLDDKVKAEREMGIDAALPWLRYAKACVVYTDYGISEGMRVGIERAEKAFVPVEYRTLKRGIGV